MTPDDILEQTQWDFFWIPNDAKVVDRPEILYVYCPRDSKMLNTVTRTRSTPEQLSALIEEVKKHHGAQSRWLVRDTDWTKPLEKELTKAQYKPSIYTYSMAIETDRYAKKPGNDFDVLQVSSKQELLDSASVLNVSFPNGYKISDKDADQFLKDCTGPNARVRRFIAYERKNRTPVCFGGLTIFPKLSFGLLWGGGTIPEIRGKGAYTSVLAARIDYAKKAGLKYVGLYAITDTSAPIVTKQGFKTYGAMTYWEILPPEFETN